MNDEELIERFTADFTRRADNKVAFSYDGMRKHLEPYKHADNYLITEKQLWDLILFARRDARMEERARCVRVCEWHGEYAFTKASQEIYLSLADELEEAREP